jgi:transglutaminase/protease-like cytokinesis protein 3
LNKGRTDLYGVMESRRSICQGYAELTSALMRSIGILSKILLGYAMGVGTEGQDWRGIDLEITNHAWNEVFAEGRWIIIYTTWNSSNIYQPQFNSANEYIGQDFE